MSQDLPNTTKGWRKYFARFSHKSVAPMALGLGLASNQRLYVVGLDAENNRVVIGAKDQLLSDVLTAGDLRWVSGQPPADLNDITAKIRYKAPGEKVELNITDGTAHITFHQPQLAITPGQSVVLYRGDVVLGGGIIEGAR